MQTEHKLLNKIIARAKEEAANNPPPVHTYHPPKATTTKQILERGEPSPSEEELLNMLRKIYRDTFLKK